MFTKYPQGFLQTRSLKSFLILFISFNGLSMQTRASKIALFLLMRLSILNKEEKLFIIKVKFEKYYAYYDWNFTCLAQQKCFLKENCSFNQRDGFIWMLQFFSMLNRTNNSNALKFCSEALHFYLILLMMCYINLSCLSFGGINLVEFKGVKII